MLSWKQVGLDLNIMHQCSEMQDAEPFSPPSLTKALIFKIQRHSPWLTSCTKRQRLKDFVSHSQGTFLHPRLGHPPNRLGQKKLSNCFRWTHISPQPIN